MPLWFKKKTEEKEDVVYDDKPKFREYRKLAKRLFKLDRSLFESLSFYGEKIHSALQAAHNLKLVADAEKLKNTSVDELYKTKLGIRVNNLKRAGIKNIWELSRKTNAELLKIPGIGQASVNKIRVSVQEYENEIAADTTIKIDPKKPYGYTDKLVKDLYVIKNGRRLEKDVREVYSKYHTDIFEALYFTKPLKNWFVWSISSQKKKDLAIQYYYVIEKMISSNFVDQCEEVFARRKAILKAKHDEYWKDFMSDSVSYYTTYENLQNKTIQDSLERYKRIDKIRKPDYIPNEPSYTPNKVEYTPNNPVSIINKTESTSSKPDYIPRKPDPVDIFDEPKESEIKLTKQQEMAVNCGVPIELAIETSNVQLKLHGLKKELRLYQEYGAKFVLNHGAILLGDEMGLGKTAQAIAAIVSLRNSGETHFFVVCPASVLINWCREINEWCGIMCHKIHGKDADISFNNWINNAGIGVSTYETLDKLALPSEFIFSLLVVDEAHYVKNPDAIRSINVLHFRQRAKRALYMTGTPLENKVDEMCNLINCLNPSVAMKVRGYTSFSSAAEFRKIVAPVYLRRTRKDVVKELPDKLETEEWCELTSDEKTLYRQFVFGGSFSDMRQLSWKISDPSHSSKGRRLREIVDEAISSGDKVIVFSYFLDTIDKAGKILDCKKFGPINGSVPPQQRQTIIDDFSKYPYGAVLLSQIQAGGTGLNIQAANVVILCEPQLKPSIENQAISRSYRMGQINKVMVYRLLTENTVDERIFDLVLTKQEIFDEFADKSVSGMESMITNSEINKIISDERQRLGA